MSDGTFRLKLEANENVITFKKEELAKYLKAISPTHTDKGNIVIHSGWFGQDDSE